MSVLLYSAHGEPLITKASGLEIPDDFQPDDVQLGVACSECGCTDEDGCPPDGCSWVAPGLCSTCRPDLAECWAVAPELVRYVAAGALDGGDS